MAPAGRPAGPRRPARRAAVAGALALVALLGACSSEPPPSVGPLPVAPNAPSTPSGPPAPGVEFRPCGNRYECGVVQVPIDYANPTGPTIGVAVTRVPARDQARKVGVLMVNPGGPGGSGIELAQSRSIPDALKERFDVIGFDPRGVGASSGLDCPVGADTPYFGDPDPGDPLDEAAANAAVDRYNAGCAQKYGPLLPHLGTRNVARDMDRLRAALGEEKINYLGFSYGTSIGQTYAQMFPQRIRTMVLDGVVDLSKPGLDSAQAASFENSLRQFATSCRTDPACAAGPDPIAMLDRLRARLATSPIPAREPGRPALSVGLLEIGVVYPLYSKKLWPTLARALAAADRGDPGPMLDSVDSYFEGSSIDAYNAVTCLDNAWPTEDPQVVAASRATEAVAPHFTGNVMISGFTCADWPAPQQPLTPLANYTGPPMVVIGTRNDPATPYRNSVDLATRLTGSALITYEGDGHTVFGDGVKCVDDQVINYFVTAARPSQTECR